MPLYFVMLGELFMAIENSILVVRSITYAMKGQKLLESKGISEYVERNPFPNSSEGCGYGLRVQGDVSRAVSILEAAGVKISEIKRGKPQ